jgi:hypothetical protein
VNKTGLSCLFEPVLPVESVLDENYCNPDAASTAQNGILRNPLDAPIDVTLIS